MPRFGRTSLRLSLQFALLYSVLAATIFVGAYWYTDSVVSGWLKDQMASETSVLEQTYRREGISGLVNSVNVMTNVNFENVRVFQLIGADGKTLAGNISGLKTQRREGYVPTNAVEIEGQQSAEVLGYWMTHSQIGPYTLVQGTGNNLITEVLEALALTLVLGFILIVALGSCVGVWVGRLTESRIQAISATLEKVSAGVLSARVTEEDRSHDDLSRVSAAINKTLTQLEALVESQVQISNDIAHDLRTPLQRLRQRLERMASQEVVDPNDAELALEQVEQLIGTFNALLRIAQIEAGNRRERFQSIDMVALVSNVHEAFEPSAEEGGQTLVFQVSQGAARVFGDPDLLMQLVSNLVENALRHTPVGTEITVDVTAKPSGIVLSVSDTGPGIDPQDRGKVLRRFYRGEKSRTTEGNGLGLSLCAAIAELHDAKMQLKANNPGLCVEVTFPPTA